MNAEDEAFDLLREIVNLARRGWSYKAQLEKLRQLLPQAPGIKAVLMKLRVDQP